MPGSCLTLAWRRWRRPPTSPDRWAVHGFSIGVPLADAWSRRVVGWSIADHIRAELVADAVQMATKKGQPPRGQVLVHSDHGGQYTSWLFGNRLRDAGLLGSIDDCFDNSVAEAFFSSLQRDLLDQHDWHEGNQLATAMFERIECWHNPHRRHSYNNGLRPLDYESATRHDHPHPTRPSDRGTSTIIGGDLMTFLGYEVTTAGER